MASLEEFAFPRTQADFPSCSYTVAYGKYIQKIIINGDIKTNVINLKFIPEKKKSLTVIIFPKSTFLDVP